MCIIWSTICWYALPFNTKLKKSESKYHMVLTTLQTLWVKFDTQQVGNTEHNMIYFSIKQISLKSIMIFNTLSLEEPPVIYQSTINRSVTYFSVFYFSNASLFWTFGQDRSIYFAVLLPSTYLKVVKLFVSDNTWVWINCCHLLIPTMSCSKLDKVYQQTAWLSRVRKVTGNCSALFLIS